MCSIAASCASVHFTKQLMQRGIPKIAMFDARVFTIPDAIEIENYLIWRQRDATRNSLQMAARAVYSHAELEGKGMKELHDLLHAKNINWNNYTSGEKRGRCIVKHQYNMANEYKGYQNGQAPVPETIIAISGFSLAGEEGAEDWRQTPIFTKIENSCGILSLAMPAFSPPEETV